MYQVPVKFQAVGTTVNETDKDPALLNLMMSWLRHVKYHIHFSLLRYYFHWKHATNALKEKNNRL